ncbi:uncharacterized protein LOC131155834 [Malania oleifera]|uniref:uncharacterized protein LOC131155834 n=1 Tax=Malania oleifera TaxID=397392 RepID=UPI0025ADB655|nr:uncharacterized protein LOC131155834 [Malania oleifera]
MDRKRKLINHHRDEDDHDLEDDDDDDFLNLSLTLALHPTRRRRLPSPLPRHPPLSPVHPPPQQPHLPLQLAHTHPLFPTSFPSPPPHTPAAATPPQEPAPAPAPIETATAATAGASSRGTRMRRPRAYSARELRKRGPVPPPYPWATAHRARVHSLSYLLAKPIARVSGEVQCKRCERVYEIEFDLKEKFMEVGSFIAKNKANMHDRAPPVWMSPVLPNCRFCEQENSVKPVIAERKKDINWLFLLLGQMLGCCTLEQLKYFCKHTDHHRTGAKDRVLYLTYLALCKQLDPTGPFDR